MAAGLCLKYQLEAFSQIHFCTTAQSVQRLGFGPYYASMHRSNGHSLDPHSGERCQPASALKETVGMRQAWRQPIREEATTAILDGCGKWGRKWVMEETILVVIELKCQPCNILAYIHCWNRKHLSIYHPETILSCHYILAQESPQTTQNALKNGISVAQRK